MEFDEEHIEQACFKDMPEFDAEFQDMDNIASM
jgi:hypothetical protein